MNYPKVLNISVLLLAGGLSLNASAQIPPVYEPYNGGCLADLAGGTLNCTANDVIVALVTASDSDVRCITGLTAQLNLDTVFEINAGSERDDIAAWIPLGADLGKNMLLTTANGGPTSCRSTAFDAPISADPNGTGPVVVEDLDGDQCGDANGVNAQFTHEFTQADVACEGSVGGALVDALVSWHLRGNDPVCNNHQDYAINHKKSKCSYSTSFVDLAIVGKLRICKAAAEGTDGDFQFEIVGGQVWQDGTGADPEPTPATSPFTLNPADGTGGVVCETFDVITAQPDAPNEVTIAETGVPLESQFQLTNITCNNNTRGGGAVDFERDGDALIIELTEGDLGTGGTNAGQSDVTCTFINVEGGSLTIVKDANPNGAQVFDFTHDVPETSGSFQLDDDGNGALPNSVTFDNLDGEYGFTEQAVEDWTLTEVYCEGAEGEHGSYDVDLEAGTLDIGIDPGQDVTCTFTNVQAGYATVTKEVLPETDTTTEFTFTGDVAGTLTNGNSLSLKIAVPPATVTSTEAVPEGWDLQGIVCNDGDSSGAEGTATFNVAPGESVTCVFTNAQKGHIVVEKAAIGGDDTFYFNASWSDPFGVETSGGTGSVSTELSASDEVAAGEYSVDEITEGLASARWNYDGVVCTGDEGEESNTAIDLDPGETVTCVFTNSKYARITVVKEALGFDDEYCFGYFDPAFGDYVDTFCIETSGGYGSEEFDNATQGGWYFNEFPADNNTILMSASCDNGDDPSAVEVEAGDDVTCTFVNGMPTPVPVNNIWALLALLLSVLALGWYYRPARH